MPDRYRLEVAGPALRALEKVPERVAPALVEFMTGRLLDNPQRLGKPLLGRFTGLYAARVRDYRIRYRIVEDAGIVVVLHVAPRSEAYRPR